MAPTVQKIEGLVQVPGGYYAVEFGLLEEGAYLSRVPALESSTTGNTLVEAESMVADMVAAWLAVAEEDGLPIPPPRPLIRIDLPLVA